MVTWKLNTSNLNKYKEFERLFSQHSVNLEATHVDLKEIDADPLLVIAHKASQLDENTLVEDTSLDVEGASVGVHVRWLMEHLSDYVGHTAEWTVLLAYHQNNQVFIFKGSVKGIIVLPRDQGFGFDPVFQPDGSNLTLAEAKPDAVNARALAVQALFKHEAWAIQPLIKDWSGPWQTY